MPAKKKVEESEERGEESPDRSFILRLNDALKRASAAPGAPAREDVPDTDLVEEYPNDPALAIIPEGYIEPWSRQPDETDEDWKAFVYFRSLGISRTTNQVAERYGWPLRKVHDISYRHHWRDRLTPYDQHMDRVYRLELQQALAQMAKKHADILGQATSGMMLPFWEIQARIEVGDPDFLMELHSMSARTLIDLAIKSGKALPMMLAAERLARGLPTEITKVEGEVTHTHELEDTRKLGEILAVLDRSGLLARTLGHLNLGSVVEAEVVGMDDDQSDLPEAEPQAVGASPR